MDLDIEVIVREVSAWSHTQRSKGEHGADDPGMGDLSLDGDVDLLKRVAGDLQQLGRRDHWSCVVDPAHATIMIVQCGDVKYKTWSVMKRDTSLRRR